MIKKTYPVRTRLDIGGGKIESKKVGEASYFEFESVSEAVSQLTETTVLALINTQHKTNEMNKVRAEFSGGPTKEALRKLAYAELTSTRMDELVACAGDADKVEALINKIMDEKKANFEKERNDRLAALPTDNGASEGDDE